MKHVFIKTGEKSYVIDSRNVIEIVPLVELKSVDQNNPYLTGTMQYRGKFIPVADLCVLLSGSPYRKKFSTRIVIVQLQGQTLGLIAESVTDLVTEDAAAEKLDLQSLLASCL
jgi:chemotaxis-related protein WspB